MFYVIATYKPLFFYFFIFLFLKFYKNMGQKLGSNNHFAGTGSPPSGSHFSRFSLAAPSDSAASSPASAAESSDPSASPLGLQFCVDLSFYPLQKLPSSAPSAHQSVARQHPMVLRPRL